MVMVGHISHFGFGDMMELDIEDFEVIAEEAVDLHNKMNEVDDE